MRMERYAHIIGWGKCVPSKVVTNDDLSKMVDTTDAWIRERSGIGERHVATKETTASMSLMAAQQAIQVAGITPSEIDLIIVATVTPEHSFPSTSCLVQDQLGAENAAAFDLAAGCSGFVYGLSMATGMIRAGVYNTILIIGAETLSRITDWKDRSTCVLFGDGAGAVVLRGSEQFGGVLSTVLGADGSGGELLILPAGGSKAPASLDTVTSNQHTIRMNGREVYRFATRVMVEAAKQVMAKAKLPLDELDLLIPHQANLRIIEYAAKSLKLPTQKVFVNLERYGNTSSASIPIALCEAVECHRINAGDHIVMVGFGAGLTWAAAAIEWSSPTVGGKPTPQEMAQSNLRYAWAHVRSFGNRVARRIDATVSRAIDHWEGRTSD